MNFTPNQNVLMPPETVQASKREVYCIGGKESNSFEEVEPGLIHSAENVYTEYEDERRDEWETKIRPALKEISLAALVKETRLSRRMLIDARTGRRRPHLKNQALIKFILKRRFLASSHE